MCFFSFGLAEHWHTVKEKLPSENVALGVKLSILPVLGRRDFNALSRFDCCFKIFKEEL